MKTISLLSMLSTLIALSAFAKVGNEGPQALLPEVTVIAQKTVSGGFGPNTLAVSIQILSDGSVYKISQPVFSPATPMTSLSLGWLSKESLSSLKATVNSLKTGALTDLDKDKPNCADGPEVSYFVINERKQQIRTSEESGCHHSLLEMNDQAGQSEQIEAILNGFAALAQ